MIIKNPELRERLRTLDVKMFMARDAGDAHEHNSLVREYNGILKTEEDKQLCSGAPASDSKAGVAVHDTCRVD